MKPIWWHSKSIVLIRVACIGKKPKGENIYFAQKIDTGMGKALALAAGADIAWSGLMGIFGKADRSFEPSGTNKFRAVNRNGCMVDLIKPMPKPLWKKDPAHMGGSEDLIAAEIRNFQWLLAAPKFSRVVIGEDGFPATMVVPDPRAFVLHKLWLRQQDDREPVKKSRDQNQALAVAQLIFRYQPQYRFRRAVLRMFPADVVQMAVY